MDSLPTVAIAAASDPATLRVQVQRGSLIRSFEVAAARLADRLVAVLISEFGMAQPDAHAHAATEIAAQASRQDVEAMRAEKAADYDRMAAELGRTQAALAKTTDDLAEARAAVEAGQGQIAELSVQIEHLTAPAKPNENSRGEPPADAS